MSRRSIITLALGILSILAAACSAAGPRQIASYPADSNQGSPVYPPDPSQFVYNATLEMEVFDPVTAASRSKELAEAYGGYLVSSQTYHWDNTVRVSVVLAVPANNFEKLRSSLLRLGKLKQEKVSGEWEEWSWAAFSEVSVIFQPSALAWPKLPNGYNPGRTFRQAADVFWSVFGFLGDIIIWLLVVVAPFALIAWGGWRLARRLRRSARS